MIVIKKNISVLLICIIALPFFGCGFWGGHDELKCAELHLDISLKEALLLKEYTDKGYDGSLCYHVFSVPDGFENDLNSEWQEGKIPTEALEICEESSYVNGEKVISFPAVESGLHFYDHFNDGANERVCLAFLDTDNDVLYYFFVSGQMVQYSNNR